MLLSVAAEPGRRRGSAALDMASKGGGEANSYSLIKGGDIREEERCRRVLIDAPSPREEERGGRGTGPLKGRRKRPRFLRLTCKQPHKRCG